MAPAVASLAQSEAKSRFVERLRLDVRDPAQSRLYDMMKAEATAGWDRIQSTVDTLSPGRRENGTLQISETAKHREILEIYRLASPETRAIYELGHDTVPIEAENWVIRWMLWHVERNRTNRSSSSRTAHPSPPEATAVQWKPHEGRAMDPPGGSRPPLPTTTAVTIAKIVVPTTMAIPPSATAAPSLYPYDPVRDR